MHWGNRKYALWVRPHIGYNNVNWKECSWKRNCLLGALQRTEDLGSVFSGSVYSDDYSCGSRGPGYTSGLLQNLTSFPYLLILQACKIQGRSVMEARTQGPVSCWDPASYRKIGFLIWNSWVGYVQNWEGEVEVAVEDPGYWRCQSRGMFTESNGWHWLGPVHERWYMSKQPRKSGIPSPLEPRWCLQQPQMLDMKLLGLQFVLLDSVFVLARAFLIWPHSSPLK